MAVPLRFYSIIIPAKNLERVLDKTELEKLIKEADNSGRVWFDGSLYCEQTMNSADNEAIISFWEDKGLTVRKTIDGQECWKDLCLIEFPEKNPTLPCNWIKVFSKNNNMFAKLKKND